MQLNQVSVRSVPSSELFVKAPQTALGSSKEAPSPTGAARPSSDCQLHTCESCGTTNWLQALGSCTTALTRPRGSSRCFCCPPSTTQSPLGLTEGCHWHQYGWVTGRELYTCQMALLPPSRQQSQLTSTSTNTPAVQTVLRVLAFSCFYYGKHGSLW